MGPKGANGLSQRKGPWLNHIHSLQMSQVHPDEAIEPSNGYPLWDQSDGLVNPEADS